MTKPFAYFPDLTMQRLYMGSGSLLLLCSVPCAVGGVVSGRGAVLATGVFGTCMAVWVLFAVVQIAPRRAWPRITGTELVLPRRQRFPGSRLALGDIAAVAAVYCQQGPRNGWQTWVWDGHGKPYSIDHTFSGSKHHPGTPETLDWAVIARPTAAKVAAVIDDHALASKRATVGDAATAQAARALSAERALLCKPNRVNTAWWSPRGPVGYVATTADTRP